MFYINEMKARDDFEQTVDIYQKNSKMLDAVVKGTEEPAVDAVVSLQHLVGTSINLQHIQIVAFP